MKPAMHSNLKPATVPMRSRPAFRSDVGYRGDAAAGRCAVDDAIEGGVGEGRIADDVVPAIDGHLAGEQDGAGVVAVLERRCELGMCCTICSTFVLLSDSSLPASPRTVRYGMIATEGLIT
jgi:hypothetical protein